MLLVLDHTWRTEALEKHLNLSLAYQGTVYRAVYWFLPSVGMCALRAGAMPHSFL